MKYKKELKPNAAAVKYKLHIGTSFARILIALPAMA